MHQTAPEGTSSVGHYQAAIGHSEGRCSLTCTGYPPCRTPNDFPLLLFQACKAQTTREEIDSINETIPVRFNLLPRGSSCKRVVSQPLLHTRGCTKDCATRRNVARTTPECRADHAGTQVVTRLFPSFAEEAWPAVTSATLRHLGDIIVKSRLWLAEAWTCTVQTVHQLQLTIVSRSQPLHILTSGWRGRVWSGCFDVVCPPPAFQGNFRPC